MGVTEPESDNIDHHLTQVMEGMMLPLDGKNRWMAVLEIVILFYGIFLRNSACQSTGTNETNKCRQKNLMFVSARRISSDVLFPSEVIHDEISGQKICFNIQKDHNTHTDTDCCTDGNFNCNFEMLYSNADAFIILDNETLSKQDIVVMKAPDTEPQCFPSQFYRKGTGICLSIHNCFEKDDMKNIRLTINDFNRTIQSCDPYQDSAGTEYMLTFDHNNNWRCVHCMAPENISLTPENISLPMYNSSSAENAVNLMNGLADLVESMDSSTALLTVGDIKGAITKLSRANPTKIIFGITAKKDLNIFNKDKDLSTDFNRLVHIPKGASQMAVQKNGTFAAVLLFPGVHEDQDTDGHFLNNEMLGIDMGTEISNLSHTIDIHYKNVTKNGLTASCRSWDGKGTEQIWVTDGCETLETDDSIKCRCSHLTFFAIMMSPPPQNMSSTDFTALTYITSVGCGLSMFFLAVGLFMHCLIRKGKASQTTKVLINLFIAMFNLNLSFLVNEMIARLGNFGACVAIAAFMHYALLATFSWFFMMALHLFFNLRKIPNEVKHYMTKICVAGWVTPSVVVIALVASGQYGYLVISVNDGNSAKMCWISDAVLHKWLNAGYYAVVFIFTITIFIITVRQIIALKPTAVKSPDGSTTAYSFSILSLFVQLGITWAFAFFSHGPMVIASYYIFTILNSFQGFFLFIYYYCSSRPSKQDKSSTVSSSSTATSNTVIANPFQ